MTIIFSTFLCIIQVRKFITTAQSKLENNLKNVDSDFLNVNNFKSANSKGSSIVAVENDTLKSNVGELFNFLKDNKLSSSSSSSSNCSNIDSSNNNNNNNEMVEFSAEIPTIERFEEDLYVRTLGQLRYEEIPTLSGYHFR